MPWCFLLSFIDNFHLQITYKKGEKLLQIGVDKLVGKLSIIYCTTQSVACISSIIMAKTTVKSFITKTLEAFEIKLLRVP